MPSISGKSTSNFNRAPAAVMLQEFFFVQKKEQQCCAALFSVIRLGLELALGTGPWFTRFARLGSSGC